MGMRQALRFFAPLAASVGACAAEHAAKAERELGMLPEAIVSIGRVLEAQPSAPSLLLLQGEPAAEPPTLMSPWHADG